MKISVIMPCYNQGHFLEETCNSISNQTYQNWEVLIINDGSTDETESIALNISDKDSRFKYFYKENHGLSSARNHGLNNISGDYVQFLDSDDLLSPSKLDVSLKSKKDLIVTNFNHIESNKITPPFCDLTNQNISFQNILNNWDIEFSISIHCGLIRSTLLKDIRFNEKLKAKEDWFFWLEYLNKKPSTAFINEPLVTYRLHGSSMTQDYDHMLKNTQKVFELITNKFNDKQVKPFLLKRLHLLNKNMYSETLKTTKSLLLN